ncbi:MAG: hypothetical protein A2508_02100 [Candidatus Lambdaproteobacteria bacterium RIFOXYD12_FULL_49_8]|uniref:Pyruvate, phosphate dikinase n=1 Tax=Candidatus Lambdaproteobacteria bacterium RIFOXYD2_FULL_50_16 TaxID=1817772 RepID=A0A1F6GG97_9PROT|nr:MAG: hypothetical protein A2527_10705 [Candidatus Lambdaproteobacteria bacterium RIFOXYD2_FULL_50_16]OGG98113.1 MAG: hypothetical protein A2508_02100 [Candidatus Lambdaproteobacteria bacterium RIFOXYD12_FULL_49_8]
MNHFKPLASEIPEDFPLWLRLQRELGQAELVFWIEARTLVGLTNSELERIVKPTLVEIKQQVGGIRAARGLLYAARIYGMVDLEPLASLDHLGFNEKILQRLGARYPEDDILRAWALLLQDFGDLSDRPPSQPEGSAQEQVQLLLLGRARGFAHTRQHQIENCLQLMAKKAPEGAILVLEPVRLPEPGEVWALGEVAPRDESKGGWDPQIWVKPFRAFNEPFRGEPEGQQPPWIKMEELSATWAKGDALDPPLAQIVALVEESVPERCAVRFLWDRNQVRPLGLRRLEAGNLTSRLSQLLDRFERGLIPASDLARSITPSQLEDLLATKLEDLDKLIPIKTQTQFIGAPGAASGRVYFSAARLLAAPTGPKILMVTEITPQDTEALRQSSGVITAQSSYASHGPVMARSLGLPSLLLPKAKISLKSARIGGDEINEGQWISLEVPQVGEPGLYRGQSNTLSPDPSTVARYTEALRGLPMPAEVLANTEELNGIKKALKWGAQGIGLFRLENLMMEGPRLTWLRGLVLAGEDADGVRQLKESLKSELMELMAPLEGKRFCLRLLDLSINDLLPKHGLETGLAAQDLAKAFIRSRTDKWIERIEAHRETNPMLGHRGVRMGLTSYFITRLQVQALLGALDALIRNGKKPPKVQLLIPYAATANEIKLLRRGGRDPVDGIEETIASWAKLKGFNEVPFSIELGAMIELPSAALDAYEIAREVSFFSFGGNDLTQSTMGLSREDWGQIQVGYAPLGLFGSDPFQHLTGPVKELIGLGIKRGKALRPDLKARFCGEQPLVEEDLLFLLDQGVSQISVPPGRVPGMLLKLVRLKLAIEQESTLVNSAPQKVASLPSASQPEVPEPALVAPQGLETPQEEEAFFEAPEDQL